MTRHNAYFDTARDYTLQFTTTHTLVSTVTSSLPLLGSGFQRRTFPFFWAPELSRSQLPASNSSSLQWLSPSSSLVIATESESDITTDSQSASLSWNKAPIWGLRPDFYYCQTIACLLTRGRVCRLQLLLALASAVLFGSDSRGTRDHILLSQIRDFVASYDSQGYGGGIRPRLHNAESESMSYITTDGQSANCNC
jgi:hypothetical protein